LIEHRKEESLKRSKLQETKPYVYEKMMKFTEKIKRGESIAILQFQYNYACNFKCVHCSIKRFQDNKNQRQFTIPDVENLSKQADELGLARFVITGGEPLIFKDFDELVKAIDPQKFYINMDTNGWFLDDKRARHLKDIGVDRVQLSIDSLNPEEHDSFRRKKGAFYRAMNAVNASLTAGLDIFIQTVVTKQRLHSKEFLNFIECFNDSGIGVFVTYAKPVGAWENHFEGLVDQKDMQFFRELEKSHNVWTHITPAFDGKGGCIAGRNIISVTRQMDILCCPYFPVSMGNLRDEPLVDILERCMRLNVFRKNTCLLAEDRNFINKYLVGTYTKSLPVDWHEVFTKEDFV
jgi:MoaA/NifB/PqqE/SkfB family radical SAM enzyme